MVEARRAPAPLIKRLSLPPNRLFCLASATVPHDRDPRVEVQNAVGPPSERARQPPPVALRDSRPAGDCPPTTRGVARVRCTEVAVD
jgi:hypothetical protein